MNLYKAAMKEREWALKTLSTFKEMYDDAANHGHKELARIIEQGEDYLYSVIKYKEDREV